MTLFLDLGSQKFINGVGFQAAPRLIEMKRGDTGSITLVPVSDGVEVSFPAGTNIVLEMKLAGKYDSSPLVRADSFVQISGGAGRLRAVPGFDSPAIDAALNVNADQNDDLDFIEVMMEVSYQEPGNGWLSSNTVAARIYNDVVREGENLPEILRGDYPGVQSSAEFQIGGLDANSESSVRFGAIWVSFTGFGEAGAGDPTFDAGGVISQAEFINYAVEILSGNSPSGVVVTNPVTHPDLDLSFEFDQSGGGTLIVTAKEPGVAGDLIEVEFSSLSNDADSTFLAGGEDRRPLQTSDFLNLIPGSMTQAQIDRFKVLLGIA